MARARFISRYGNYSVGVQSLITENYATGKSKTLQRRIDAQFHRNLVTDSDLAVAVQSFQFPGLPEDFDTNAQVSPRYRVSVWDSEWAKTHEGFTDEEIELTIDKLRTSSGYGRNHVEIDVAAKMPFPNYDDLSADEILQLLKLTGLPLEGVIAYERENQNRADLLRRLEGVEASDDAVVVSA